jgi:hypothetical protein
MFSGQAKEQLKLANLVFFTICIGALFLGACGNTAQVKGPEQATQTSGGPTIDSISPSSGAGGAEAFTVTNSDPGGFSNLDATQLLINSELKGDNACSLYANSAGFYLFNDAGTVLVGPAAPGTTLSNSQCSLVSGKSLILGAGNTRTVTFSVTFTHSFAGMKGLYLYTTNRTGMKSTWEKKGTWTVP